MKDVLWFAENLIVDGHDWLGIDRKQVLIDYNIFYLLPELIQKAVTPRNMFESLDFRFEFVNEQCGCCTFLVENDNLEGEYVCLTTKDELKNRLAVNSNDSF